VRRTIYGQEKKRRRGIKTWNVGPRGKKEAVTNRKIERTGKSAGVSPMAKYLSLEKESGPQEGS